MSYVGRFAPSPTGPLHIGSLTTAAASFLHARQANGEWLLRIEDIDPPRARKGAAGSILSTLETLALHWDRSVCYQSKRTAQYRRAAEGLIDRGLAFRCSCSRSEIREHGDPSALGYRYPGTCRTRQVHRGTTAIRVLVDPGEAQFEDGLQGVQRYELQRTAGDYVIYRRNELPAYHLAVVLDDAEQGVSCIVRGTDLLEVTAAHVHLQGVLELPTPRYWHLPVIVNDRGQKLSKQSGARPVDVRNPSALVARVLRYLGLLLPSDLTGAPPAELWAWATEHWKIVTHCGRFQLQA